MAATIDSLLREMVERGGTDLHVKAGRPPIMRLRGDLVAMDHPQMPETESTEMLLEVLNDERRHVLYSSREVDLSYFVAGVSRFRVNMFWQRGKMGAVFRAIPYRIKTIDELLLPEVTKQIAMLPRGLILVTGPTGSGKSTTLAAMIDHINQQKRCHILTIEDPIEYVHTDRVSIINQRELGTDTHQFSSALKHVMRQNPDIILVGEMRDLETIRLAITAAETGHLVLSTLHTVDAAQTIDRIVDAFPGEMHNQIRAQLASVLLAAVGLRLVPRLAGPGRRAAVEILIATDGVRNMIREGKTHQLRNAIVTGRSAGMQTLEAHLSELVARREIALDAARAVSSRPQDVREPDRSAA